MATGRLGKNALAATTNTTVYTVPATVAYAEVSVYALNTSASNATFRLAVSTAATPATADYLEYGAEIPANGGVLERTNIVCSPGELIVAYSSVANVVVRVSGIEYTQTPK